MKKLFLTAVIALSTLVASAQFMVVTTFDNSDSTEGAEAITNNMGFGYAATDDLTIGIMRNGEDTYEVFARYNLPMADGMYASIQTPTSGESENMSIGLGMAVNVWEGLYLEPSFNMPMSKDDEGNRESDFRLGLGYRF